jgi:hypothetical protein
MLRLNPHFFYRKKTYNYEETQLSKVLSLFDLTALGVSCTLGSGIYVIAGKMSKMIKISETILRF